LLLTGCKSIPTNPPFSETQVTLHKTYDVSPSSPLTAYWRFDEGYSSDFRFPFYWGKVSVAIALSAYESNDTTIPSFKTLQPSVGWSLPIMFGPLEWNNGVQVGNAIMRFEDSTTLYRGEKTETESSISYVTDITLILYKNVGIQGLYRYNHLFTYHRIIQHYIGVGIIAQLKNNTRVQQGLK